jgi:hypothetical protein
MAIPPRGAHRLDQNPESPAAAAGLEIAGRCDGIGCGQKLRCPQSSTSGLHTHLKSKHPFVAAEVVGQQNANLRERDEGEDFLFQVQKASDRYLVERQGGTILNNVLNYVNFSETQRDLRVSRYLTKLNKLFCFFHSGRSARRSCSQCARFGQKKETLLDSSQNHA